MMATVTSDNATRTDELGQPAAVGAVDLVMADGEFLVLVDSSVCGTSTTLRRLAGLATDPAAMRLFDAATGSRLPAA
jgi:sn-glycerol 3-phosphate transport system ATP-binding protein